MDNPKLSPESLTMYIFFLVLPILREIWLEAELISIKISYSLGNDTYYFLQAIYSNNTAKRPMNYPETR